METSYFIFTLREHVSFIFSFFLIEPVAKIIIRERVSIIYRLLHKNSTPSSRDAKLLQHLQVVFVFYAQVTEKRDRFFTKTDSFLDRYFFFPSFSCAQFRISKFANFYATGILNTSSFFFLLLKINLHPFLKAMLIRRKKVIARFE